MSLTADDGLASSEQPDNVRIVAVSLEDMVIRFLRETIARINRFDNRVFKFKWMRKDLTGRINHVIKMADKEHYRIALATLQYWVLPKMDGCAEDGRQDKGSPLWEFDWLIIAKLKDRSILLSYRPLNC